MKLKTALVPFLLSFFIVGCYDDLMLPEGNAEPNRMPITDKWATGNSVDAKKSQNILKLNSTNRCKSCDLSKVNFTKKRFRYADFDYANLEYANFDYANLESSDFDYANLRNARFRYAKLNNAYFDYADLTNADLTGAEVKGAHFERAIFCNTKTPWGLDNSGCE